MGVIYLVYSAYFLSSDFGTMTEVINFTLALIYAVLGLSNFKSLSEQLNLIKMLTIQADNAVPVAFIDSLKLKKNMLNNLKWVLILFFIPRFLLYSYTFMNSQDEFANVRLQTYVQFFEVFIFNFLLWVFRPRKEWPDYFSLGIGGLANEAQRAGRPEMDI